MEHQSLGNLGKPVGVGVAREGIDGRISWFRLFACHSLSGTDIRVNSYFVPSKSRTYIDIYFTHVAASRPNQQP